MFSTFGQDLARKYPPPRTLRSCVFAFFDMGIWAVGIFRFGKWVTRLRFQPARMVLLAVYFLLYKFSEALSGIRISSESEIGPGLVVHNFSGILIHGRLGRNCMIVQGAQLISRADGNNAGWPTLGDNVFVGSGAKVVGNVHIGNNVRIGANAVVSRDVPDNARVAPPESRIIPRPGPGRPTGAEDARPIG